MESNTGKTLASKTLYFAMAKSLLSRYAVYVVELISAAVLARIFNPESFGIVAAMMVFVVFFQLIGEVGLGPAIINVKTMELPDRNGLFGLTLLIGVVLASVFLILGPVFRAFYALPRVDEVAPYLAGTLVFSVAMIVPNALLLREQAFFRIGYAGLAASIASMASAIGLSYIIDPLHALASKGAVASATQFFVLWYHSGKTEFGRPMLGKKFSAIKPLLAFSTYQFGFNFVNYFSRNLDDILVGRYMGAITLGIYNKAYQLMKLPLTILTFAMTPAIQPVIRKHAKEPDKVERVHRDFTFKLSLMGSAVALVIILLAKEIVLVMLGNQWDGVIPVIRILAIAVPVQVVLSTSGSFFQAMNRVDILFGSGVLGAITMVSAIVAGIVLRDINALCWFLVLAFHINFVQAYYFMYKKVFKVPFRKFLVIMLPAAAMVGAMIGYLTLYVGKAA